MAINVDLKYKTQLKGDRNKFPTLCPFCNHDFNLFDEYGSIFDNAIGFSDTNHGLMMIVECPICFNFNYFHGSGFYDYFLESIEEGTQKFFGRGSGNVL